MNKVLVDIKDLQRIDWLADQLRQACHEAIGTGGSDGPAAAPQKGKKPMKRLQPGDLEKVVMKLRERMNTPR